MTCYKKGKMIMIPKVCHVVTFKEPFTSNNITVSDSIDNNLHAHLNPMRVQHEEEKYDIESNEPSVVSNDENNVIVKHSIYCCTMKQLFEYTIVSCTTGVLLICIEYIIYIVRK
jgi:hypothetical protein